MAKKLSTEEILKQARAQASGGGGAKPPVDHGETPPAESESAAESAPQADAAEPNKPAAKPSATADILAAARAQAAGGSKEASAAKPAGATTPKSTADILAAARAQKAGGAKSAPAAKPADGEKPAAKPATKSSGPTGERPSVEEMLKAVREGKSGSEPPAVPRPKMPRKPVIKKESADTTRRNVLASLFAGCMGLFLNAFRVAWVMFAGAVGIFTLGLARFMFPNVLVEPPSQFKIGPPSDYPPGSVSTKWKALYGVWIVNTIYKGKPSIYALSTVCTHLGCTPNWLEGEQKFKCPCHGSGFYINGVNFEGPAPRPLERVGIQLAADGALEVDKGQKFQEELGQWDDPASFVEVA